MRTATTKTEMTKHKEITFQVSRGQQRGLEWRHVVQVVGKEQQQQQ